MWEVPTKCWVRVNWGELCWVETFRVGFIFEFLSIVASIDWY